MPEIRVLPKEISELIAAGEVVERPSSVIKELVENSIDAGSTLITVEIKNGGVTYIRVTDNGCGIAKSDVATAFLRHATSKVSDKKGLYEIATLGFRGEALAAISSVSRVRMLTKQKSEDTGAVYSAEGGDGVTVDDAGCPDGTTITVSDLFFNTPARMKFLKKDVAEGNSVGAVLDNMALSHPEISFRFIRDGKSVFTSPGDGKLMSAVYAVCGRDFAAGMIPVNGELAGIKVTGFTCRPSECRPKRNAQFVFLNGRYVRSGTVAQALETSYKNSAMIGRYPAAVLHITVPYGAVDINVHPAKTEVRFSDERRVFDAVMFSVKNAVAAGDERPEMKLPHGQIRMTADEYRQTVLPAAEKKTDPLGAYAEIIKASAANATRHDARVFSQSSSNKPELTQQVKETKAFFEAPKTEVQKPVSVITEAKPEVKPAEPVEKLRKDSKPEEVFLPKEKTEYIGEAFATYIIVRRGDSLFLVDKHAAHERILFNRLKAGAENAPQLLLNPEQVTLCKEDYTVLIKNTDELKKAGFEIDDFGDSTVLVRSIPSVLSNENVRSLIFEVASNLSSKMTVEVSRLERIYETMACRAAIKAGNVSSAEELKALAEAVLSSKEIMYCPHGRPVAIELKKSEIEKQFGRIQ